MYLAALHAVILGTHNKDCTIPCETWKSIRLGEEYDRSVDVAWLLFMINESWDNNCNYNQKKSRACNLLMSQGCYNSSIPFQLLLLNVCYLCILPGLHFFIILYCLCGICLLCMYLQICNRMPSWNICDQKYAHILPKL